MADFSTSLRNIAVAWLKGPNGNALLTSVTTLLNGVSGWAVQGVRARYPSTAPPDALGYIGNDRNLERGPAQTDEGYSVQLRRAFDTWRVAGNASTVLRQLAAYFTGIAQPPLRLVADRATWHEYNWSTDVVTKTKVGTNWTWDSLTGTRWFRGWVIIDSTSGPWTRRKWGVGGGKWGSSGATWGSSATHDEVQSIFRIVKKWKPAHVHAIYVIVIFNGPLFRRTDAAPPNPNGNYDVISNRNTGATYWHMSTA